MSITGITRVIIYL